MLRDIEGKRWLYVGEVARVLVHATMEACRYTSISLGWKVRPGKALAKCATCCPVPLPISSTRPRGWKYSRKYLEDRLLIALGGGGGLPRESMQGW